VPGCTSRPSRNAWTTTGDAALARGVDQRVELVHVAVDAAVGHEPEEMEAPAAFASLVDDAREDRILADRPVGDGGVDAHDVHQRDAARTEVEMTDLAVTHLAGRQADVRAARADETMRVLRVERVEAGRLGQPHGVVGLLRALPEAIEDHENDRARSIFGCHEPRR
jgi:hypothetical protein